MRELRLLLFLARHKWPWLLLGLGCSVMTLLSGVALFTLAAWFLASMALAGVSGAFFNYFLPAAGIRTLALARVISRYAERLLSHDAALRMLAHVRIWFFERLEPLLPSGLQNAHSADLLSRMRADIDLLDNFYLRLLLPTLTALIVVGCGVVFLVGFDYGLALGVFGLWLMAGGIVPLLVMRLGRAAGKRQVTGFSRLRCLVVDGLRGMEELIAYGAATRHRDLVDKESRALLRDQARLARLDGFSQAMVGWSSGMAMWLVLLLGIPLVHDGSWSPATLPMLAVFTLVSFEALQALPAAWRIWGQIRAATARIMDVAFAPLPVPEPRQPLMVPERFDLEIQGLCFTYPGSERPVLNNLTLVLNRGRRVAILGAVGSGKTTLLQLLLRFWDYDQGRIILNGRELREYSAESVRSRIAVVSQHVYLFNASIAENLRLANPHATDGQLLAAARAACIEDFILSLPNGLQSAVGQHGTRISGGQARRLAVARALLKDAPLLFLDEPTEGLDGPTEVAFWETLEPLMHNHTVLLITHRQAGLEYMDQVFELD